jgi:hypothetical protein
MNRNNLMRTGVLLFAVAAFVLFFGARPVPVPHADADIIPESAVLPMYWGAMGVKLVQAGVIDPTKLKALYTVPGEFTAEDETLLSGTSTEKLVMTKENAPYLLNLFWAVGLANEDPILEDKTDMMNPKYGGADHFASTGGWTLSVGNAMNHYDQHHLMLLTPEQQALVDKVSLGIYRPCCGNSAHFPDCNHGMAMLGLLEMMASQGASEQDMWKAALIANEYWFPDTYRTIAAYMQSKGIEWKNVNPQEVLGVEYSSGAGYAKIAAQVTQPEQQGGGSCGV